MATAEDQTPQSIVEFICQKKDQTLLDNWTRMLDRKSIPLVVRNEGDWWFQKCYQQRREMNELKLAISPDIAATKAENLFSELDCKLVGITQMKMRAEDVDALNWVKNAISCVEEEIVLIEEHKKKLENRQQEVNKQKRMELNKMVQDAEEAFKEIRLKMDALKTNQKGLKDTGNKQQDKIKHLQDYKTVIEAGIPGVNGTKTRQASLRNGALMYEKAHDYNGEMKQLDRKVTTCEEELFVLFRDLCPLLDTVKRSLCEEVKKWMEEFKHFYVELGDKPDLEELAQWCGQLGQVIADSVTIIAEWANLVPGNQDAADCHKQTLQGMMKAFLKSTCLLTEQDGYIVKVDKKNLPKFSVRVLAADNIHFELKVEALFLLEDDINSCWHGDQLNVDQLRLKSTKLDHAVQTVKAMTGRKKNHCEAVFKDLQFKDKKFNRPGKKPVHEEKYRVVFLANMVNTYTILLSLPLVVTTGANQNCLALASTMWQCFSTDVYVIPIQQQMDLPWTKVAEMLQKKMLKLCPRRQLNEDNLAHLKRRLLHDMDCSDDTLVTFKRFSEDCMPMADRRGDSCSFSFWKWFLANYNLLEKYMLPYWREGLIEGYLSKEDVERKLRECRSFKSGVFILRFSDNNIVNSQGIKSVFGTLTASVQSFTEENGEKKKKVTHLDLGGHNKQKDTTLANILKMTHGKDSNVCVFQYIYPGSFRREDTFDKYCSKGPIVEGYTGLTDQFVVDLEQALEALTISTGKHRSPSCDSESVHSGNSAASSKRSRGSNEQCPTIRTLLQGPRPADFSDSQSDMLSNISSPQQPFSPQDTSSDFSNMQITPAMELSQATTVSTATLQQMNFQAIQCPGTQIPTVVPENMNTCFAPVTMAQSMVQLSGQMGTMYCNQPSQFPGAHAPSPDNEVIIVSNDGAQNMPGGSVPNNVVVEPMEIYGNDGWEGVMDNNPEDFVVTNSSSGSTSGFTLNISELADLNVDSGSIDPLVFEAEINSGNTQ